MRSLLWISFILFFITGCSTITPSSAPPMQTSWKNREQSLNHIQSWRLDGKIGVQTAQNSGSANINWTQSQQYYTILLSGPLGTSGLKLYGQPGRASLITAEGKQFSASSAEQLLAQQWGWNLPVSNLRYWVRGLPVPGIPAKSQFDSYHRLSNLVQQGSHIQYLSYINRNGTELPQRIYISSPGITAKIVIYNWNT